MSERTLTETEFRDFLRAVIKATGGVRAFVRRSGVDRSGLYKVLRGQLPPQPRLLKSLAGVEERRVYILPADLAEWYDSQNKRLSPGHHWPGR